HFTGDWNATYFDELLSAEDYEVRGPLVRHTRDGRGVPFIGIRENTRREPVEALYPPEAITRPVTAVLTVHPGKTAIITLRNPLRDEPLAADFTAPMAELLSRTRALQATAVGGLLHADKTRREHWLYLMEPYDPCKTPVLMVHGLLATPLAWASVT